VPSRRERFDESHDGVLRSLEASLERLGLDRVDLVFVHDLDIFTPGSEAAKQARLDEFMASNARAAAAVIPPALWQALADEDLIPQAVVPMA
jgi:D-threo-aldose 1-dehydrogenase